MSRPWRVRSGALAVVTVAKPQRLELNSKAVDAKRAHECGSGVTFKAPSGSLPVRECRNGAGVHYGCQMNLGKATRWAHHRWRSGLDGGAARS
jgi:hypothetical protein